MAAHCLHAISVVTNLSLAHTSLPCVSDMLGHPGNDVVVVGADVLEARPLNSGFECFVRWRDCHQIAKVPTVGRWLVSRRLEFEKDQVDLAGDSDIEPVVRVPDDACGKSVWQSDVPLFCGSGV